jgi:hypothetical protein
LKDWLEQNSKSLKAAAISNSAGSLTPSSSSLLVWKRDEEREGGKENE